MSSPPVFFAAQKGGHFVCDGSVKLNGVSINKLASYRVTMNSFLADGGDNFTVFKLGTNQLIHMAIAQGFRAEMRSTK